MTTGRAAGTLRWLRRPASPSPGRYPPQRGQATVEFALVLPLIAALLLLIVQAGLVVRDQLLVTHAAREAARAAAVDPGADVGAIVARHTGIADVTASASNLGDTIRVDVHARVVIHLPLLAMFHPTVGLDADATMRVESG